MNYEKLMEDKKQAMKDKEKIKKDVLTLVIADSQDRYKKENPHGEGKPTDEQVLSALNTQLKQTKDSLEQFTKANRQDLIDENKQKLEVLESYFPKQLEDNEILYEIERVMKGLGLEKNLKSMGKLMGVLSKELKGKADGSRINLLVKEYLSM